jgi:hypothetical protein
VGASSLPHDPARRNYSEWTSLPWIGDGEFSNALGRCLIEKRIDTVFTAHAVVWSVLRELLPKVSPNVGLEPVKPWAAELADYRAYRDVAARFFSHPLALAARGDGAPRMSISKLAALIRMVQSTPGQCDDTKLEVLIEIFRHMPPGDIVEIGSFWGRSATALAFLSRHYDIGNLLCIDPWSQDDLRQGIQEVDGASDQIPIEEVFEAFRINLASFSAHVNYFRGRSEDASVCYAAERCFTTEDFGRINYTGEIALLHVDGNHKLESVQSDIREWTRFVRPGGWMVFDDYRWPFGTGVTVAVNEFLDRVGSSLASAFVAGEAIFFQAGCGGTSLQLSVDSLK